MNYNYENQLVAQLHNDELQRLAENERLVRESASQNSRGQNAALAQLGRVLVEVGSRLQENFGDLREELNTETQHQRA